MKLLMKSSLWLSERKNISQCNFSESERAERKRDGMEEWRDERDGKTLVCSEALASDRN